MRNHCKRNNCCSCCCPCTPQIETICTCARYVDVPMSIYNGSGYTELDCCQDTLEVLQEISNTLQRMAPETCCGGCHHCGCHHSCGSQSSCC